MIEGLLLMLLSYNFGVKLPNGSSWVFAIEEDDSSSILRVMP